MNDICQIIKKLLDATGHLGTSTMQCAQRFYLMFGRKKKYSKSRLALVKHRG